MCEIKSCINESDIVKRSVTNMIERVKTIGLKTIPSLRTNWNHCNHGKPFLPPGHGN
jgi:hypothetical protein